MTQPVSMMASTIKFGIKNQGFFFRPSDAFNKIVPDEVMFQWTDHSMKTFYEVL